MTITVKFDGDVMFTWNGSGADALALVEGLEEIAAHTGLPLDSVGAINLRLLPTLPTMLPSPRRATEAVIICYLLEATSTIPELPGKFHNYVERWDLSFDADQNMNVRVEATSVAALG
jgi:hypothetical protein